MARTLCAAFLFAVVAAACVQALPGSLLQRRDDAADGFVFQRSVIVMTHGASSLPARVMWGEPGFDFYENYTSVDHVLPAWGVGPMQQLIQGNKTVFAIGEKLKKALQDPVTVTFDVSKQGEAAHQSSISLADGLNASLLQSGSGFNGVESGACVYPVNSSQFLDTHWQNTDKPLAFDNILTRLQTILGKGKAKALKDANNNVTTEGANGRPVLAGGFHVGGLFAEAFLMQTLGAFNKSEIAWDRLTGSDLYDFLEIHQYYEEVVDRVPELVHYTQSAILSQVLDALQAPGNGSTIFVNTPSSIHGIAALLNLTWGLAGSSYKDDAVPPASAIEFQIYGHGGNGNGGNNLTEAKVYINYLYTTPEAPTDILNATVFVKHHPLRTEHPWKAFSADAISAIYPQCVNAPPAPSNSGSSSSQLSTGAVVGIIIGCVAGVVVVASVIVYKRRQARGSYRAL